MSNWLVISIVLLPVYITLIFLLTYKHKGKKRKKNKSDENFVVEIPEVYANIGLLAVFAVTVLMIIFTFSPEGRPRFFFYVLCALFLWGGMHLVIKSWAFRVVVQNDTITVFSAFRKPYAFTFDEVVEAERKVRKYGKEKTEKILITTSTGKRLVVENPGLSYDKFSEKIQQEVAKDCLTGFRKSRKKAKKKA